MFTDVIQWYSGHAAVIFVVLVGSAIALEQAGRRLGRSGPAGESGSTRTSLTSGLAFIAAKGLIAKLAVASLALFVYDHFRIVTLDLANPWVWVTIFVMRDFVYYWVHRAEHRIRLLWASHMVHHSPQTIGFTTAVRVPWMEAVYKPWLGLWVPLVGFHPVAAIALDVLAATIGQLYHTESVRRLPIIERFFVTPSAHRVHHGSNPEYIDKNFGAVLIVWDRLFGTFEPELAPVRYGIGSKRIDTPVQALVGGYPALVAEMRALPTWSQRMRHAVTAPA
jgi:sterol desaturase/sphingolipid hydroxylase (fatty acid hydroxylase superfamily)